MFQAVNRLISTWLQPGDWSRKIVSAASAASQSANRLLKQLVPIHAADTGLKPGANERWYVAVLLFALTITSHASTNNYALNRPVTVSSTYQANYGSNAVDAVVSDSSRWLGNPAGGGNWLEINFTTNVTLAQAHIYTGYQKQSGSWITNIQLQAWSGATWTNIPGSAITNNNSFAFVLTFAAPVTTDRLRFFTADTTYARLRDITLWDQPQPLYTGVTGDYVPGSALLGAPVLVNQIGYQLGAPKRFTAPTVTNGSPFTSIKPKKMKPLYTIFSFRSPLTVGAIIRCSTVSHIASSTKGTGLTAPIPPVLGPVSPSPMRL